ncbi:P-loop containing nucleoside triphosphate hydrolase protein [Nemania sp. FL0916]|nr:P-loop containing nucleoside triphosphate hydrolase protein [Nemania sp. FL0916]
MPGSDAQSSAGAACSTIPFQRNQGFYGREDQLSEIDKAFQSQDSPSNIRTVALWGVGGIGKSQIALEYAHRRWNSGTPVILWISSETEAEITKSVREAAEKLQLDGFSETNTPARNRHLILQWLQTTKTKWLVVFDNVEDGKILADIQPKVGRGDVLIICRSELLAESIAMFPMEVAALSTQESTSLIFQILDREAVNSEEAQAAASLAEQLGGIALAIDIMARYIKISRRFGTVGEFLPYYEANRRALRKTRRRGIRGVAYFKDLDTVWETAFATINPEANPGANADAMHLMEILCFVAPEAIPQSLFQVDEQEYPDNWHFLINDEKFEEAKLELLDLSLIRINGETGLISVHRLIQQAYFDQMTSQARQEAFYITFMLLRKAFPDIQGDIQREADSYDHWPACAQLHQHVQALSKMHALIKDSNLILASSEYQTLIRDDILYMLNRQQFKSAESIIKSQLSNIDPSSLEYAHMNRILRGLFERTGRSARALECAKIEFDIFFTHHSTEENDLAHAYNDIGFSSCSAFKPQEAIGYLDQAVGIALSHPEPDRYLNFEIDQFLRNRGRSKIQLGDLDGSLDDFTKAEYYHSKIHGHNNHNDGETMHERAKIAAIQGKLDEATMLNHKALEIFCKGDPAHWSVGASLYRQGCVLLLGGKYNDALHEFERARAVCQLNEADRGNAGDSARILWRMAQVHKHNGNEEEARTLLETAEGIRGELLATGDYAWVEGDEDSWDSLVGLVYR